MTNQQPPRPETDDGLPAVGGVYMDRSIADFQRACRVHLAEEQRRPNPDNALIAVLCDAVRCSRELSLSSRGRDELVALREENQRLRRYVVHGPSCRALQCRHCRMMDNRNFHGEYWHACRKFEPLPCTCGLLAPVPREGTAE